MRRTGMSGTAIRRALGLSLAQAVAAGIVAPSLAAAAEPSPGRPPGQAHAPRPGPVPRPAGSPPPAGPRMAEVLEAVAGAAGMSAEAILTHGHDRRTARPRQLVMYLLRTLCAGATLPAIGYFLGRDHSTVLYGCRKAEALLQRDPAFQALCARARAALAAHRDAETPA